MPLSCSRAGLPLVCGWGHVPAPQLERVRADAAREWEELRGALESAPRCSRNQRRAARPGRTRRARPRRRPRRAGQSAAGNRGRRNPGRGIAASPRPGHGVGTSGGTGHAPGWRSSPGRYPWHRLDQPPGARPSGEALTRPASGGGGGNRVALHGPGGGERRHARQGVIGPSVYLGWSSQQQRVSRPGSSSAYSSSRSCIVTVGTADIAAGAADMESLLRWTDLADLAGRGAARAGYQPRNWPWMVQKAASAAMTAKPVPVARRRRTGRPADQRRPRVATRRASLAAI